MNMRVTVLYEINEDHIKEIAEELDELEEYEEDKESWIEEHFEEILSECQYFYEVQGIF